MADVKGHASIKAQFIIEDAVRQLSKQFVPPSDSPVENQATHQETAENIAKSKPKSRGRNKKRPIERNPDAKDKVCPQVLAEKECRFGDKCRFMHDVAKFVSERPPDLGENCYNFETFGKCPYSIACRFSSKHITDDLKNKVNSELYEQTKDNKTVLNVLNHDLQKQLWKRKYDFSRCDAICKRTKSELEETRSHSKRRKVENDAHNNDIEPCSVVMDTDKQKNANITSNSESVLCTETPTRLEDLSSGTEPASSTETPSLRTEPALSTETPSLRTEPVLSTETPSSKTEPALSTETPSLKTEPPLNTEAPSLGTETPVLSDSKASVGPLAVAKISGDGGVDFLASEIAGPADGAPNSSKLADADVVRPIYDLSDNMKRSTIIHGRFDEDRRNKKVCFRDNLYLAPLTTVGNLPFRRVCKGLGADITCSEMAMCPNLLQGQQSEWALLKRHVSEDCYGIQLCGSYADVMSRCAQLICENFQADFIDINCGCPIDLVFKKGEGSALMGRVSRLEHIVKTMTSVMDIPLTIKMRTGIYEGKNTAHSLIPSLQDWGVSMVTIHGRSREQRYTRLANWSYIDQCTKSTTHMPVFGNGDILSYEDYEKHRQETGVAGAMIARGALIKPWLFTEIKERRHWDISSAERFEMLRNFTNYGLEHWGSDQQGVTTTRRFLLEWLSFLHRYIPLGLLERIPQRINEMPPHYFGRNDLETLMASSNCDDWIKISEMLLGPVPPNFVFLPKHKANSYKVTSSV